MDIRFFNLFLVACAVFLLPSPVPVHAQAALDEATSISLISNPEYPAPYSSVIISLDAYTINTTGASILWYINNVEQKQVQNARSIEIKTGALGEKQTIQTKILRTNLPPLTLSTVIVPTDIDIVLEASTYVPVFYKGRALPSENTTVRAIAIPHTKVSVLPSTYTYEWKYNDTVLLGGPIKGKQVIEFTMPRYEDDILSVTVIDDSGNAIGKKNILLTPARPEFHFYEENPLRGLNQKTIQDPYTLVGEEVTIHAEPYFMNTDLTARTAIFEWSVDGVAAPVQADPHTITLRHTGGSGKTYLDVTALTTQRIPQYAKSALTIFFNN